MALHNVAKKQVAQERVSSNYHQNESRRMAEIVSIQREIARHGLDLQAAMQTIAEHAKALTRSQGAIVEMLEGDEMVYRAASGNSTPHIGMRIKMQGSLAGLCVKENAVLKCDDSETDDRVDRLSCQKVGLRSMVVVPLQHDGHAIGVLKVLSSRVSAFSEEDVSTLEFTAGVLSATISNAAANEALKAKTVELERVNTQLETLAMTDGLTGLKNHRTFQDTLSSEYSRSVRFKTPLSVILADVDDFKAFNDAFGHPAGDQVLQSVAKILCETARTTDCVARYGGEEFALILPDTNAEGAAIIAQRLVKTVASYKWPNRTITISIGISTRHENVATTASMVKEADKALYLSKKRGRNCATAA